MSAFASFGSSELGGPFPRNNITQSQPIVDMSRSFYQTTNPRADKDSRTYDEEINEKSYRYFTVNSRLFEDQSKAYASGAAIVYDEPGMEATKGQGPGLPAMTIDVDSQLRIFQKYGRDYHRMNAQPRMFPTLPYLGRGSVDPDLEYQIRLGRKVDREPKSKSTMSSMTNDDYLREMSTYFQNDDKKKIPVGLPTDFNLNSRDQKYD